MMIELSTLQAIREVVTIVGIIAGLSYYIITVRNQNRSRQIQIIRGVFSRELDWGFMNWEFTDYDDFWSRYASDPEGFKEWLAWFNSLEELGVYVREGLLEVRPITLLSGNMIRRQWEKFGGIVAEHRRRNDWPRWYIEAEYLYERVAEYFERHPELQS